MRKFTRMLQVFLLVAITQNVMGQLSGTYSIGAAGVVPGETGNYATFSAAINALNTSGVNGPCTFYFTNNGTYTEPADTSLGCTGTSNINTITFKPYIGVTCTLNFTQTANYTQTASIDGSFVIGSYQGNTNTLVSTNYVTFDGSNTIGGTTKNLIIMNAATASQKSVIRIYGNNDFITFKNCIITSNSTSGSTVAPFNITNYFNVSNLTPDNLTILNNTLTSTGGNGGIAISLTNSGSSTIGNTGIAFQGNIVFAKGTRPLSFNNVADATISDNTISVDNQLGTGAGAGIYLTNSLTGAAGTFNIYNNTFTKLATLNNVVGASNGIIAIDNGLNTPKIVNIYNNVIRGFQTTSAVTNSKIYGIRHIGSSTSNVYNNSIYFPDLTNMTAFGASFIAGIVFATAAEGAPTGTMIAKNNIVFMDESSMKVWAVRRAGTGGTFTSDNNNLFINATNTTSGYVGYFNATDYQTLSAWQTASSQDAGSVNVNPSFVSATNLLPTANGLVGTSIGIVTTDIIGVTRAATPTIGAYEAPYKWSQSAASTDWGTNTNWVGNTVPGAVSVYIPPTASNMPTLATAASIKQLINNGTLTISGANTLTVSSDIINNGQISGTTAGLVLNGTTPQSVILSGTSGFINIQNFTLSNTAGATISRTLGIGKVNVTGTVSFGNVNSSTLATGGYLFLKAGFTNAARIADVTNAGANSGNSITGNVTLERFIAGGASAGTPGKRAFRFLSHPFSSYTDLTQLTNQIDITGSGATNPATLANFTQSGSNAASAFWFDPLTADNAANDAGWKEFTNTLPVSGTDANAWKVGQGIRVLVRGAKGEGLAGGTYTASDVTLSMTGTVNVANTPIATTLTSNLISNGGWNLVGNPLPSQIEIQAKLKALRTANVGGTNSNLGAVAYVWNSNKAATTRGGYDAIDLTAAGTYSLPMNGVVLVQTTVNNNNALTFSESDKTATAGVSLFRTTGTGNSVALELHDVNGNQLDETFIRFNNNTKAVFESNDGGKLLNEYALYTTTSDNVKTYINSQPEPAEGSIIPLGIYSGVAKSFVIKASGLDLPVGLTVYLKDNFLSKKEEITKAGFEYVFTTTADAASSGAGRFELVFGKQAPAPIAIASTFSVKLSPNPATDVVKVSFSNVDKSNTTISIVSAAGKTVKAVDAGNVQNGQISINIKGLAKGNYYVTLSNGTDKKTEKLIIQ